MASFSSPNETFPLPNSSALSLAVVFVDNSYNEEAIKKSRMGCPAASPYPFQKERLPARAEALVAPPWTRGREPARALGGVIESPSVKNAGPQARSPGK